MERASRHVLNSGAVDSPVGNCEADRKNEERWKSRGFLSDIPGAYEQIDSYYWRQIAGSPADAVVSSIYLVIVLHSPCFDGFPGVRI